MTLPKKDKSGNGTDEEKKAALQKGLEPDYQVDDKLRKTSYYRNLIKFYDDINNEK